MKPIHEILGITKDQHNKYMLDLWKNWAESNAGTTRQWQKILGSSAINRWFLNELSIIETTFRNKVQRFEGSNTVTVVDHRKCFNGLVTELFQHFPKPLLDEISKDHFGAVEMKYGEVTIFTSLNLN
ncbi:hypothetical protein [Flavobacterium cerinum]|uniref:Uncharacterized protein n=1 Tax=Flavobacterium cerinum TaxID=2502784 RepID=A0A3S4T3H2_9FLAO|nr:hypothetical protein [Flavobacterium cerinum]RWX03394.1 hypothetical protein EPI11_00245 [Flavobacterium cerinum]